MMLYPKKKIRKALKKECTAWANIYRGHSEERRDCELCDMFLFLNDCRLCPIMNKTGFPDCAGTPYQTWKKHQKNAHGIDVDSGLVVKCRECKILAKKHYSFVSSLLHEGGK